MRHPIFWIAGSHQNQFEFVQPDGNCKDKQARTDGIVKSAAYWMLAFISSSIKKGQRLG